MSTTIEWTHIPGYRGDVWNPTTGCNKVSQGCKHCYAEVMHRRLQAMGVKGYEQPFLAGARPVPERLHKPLKAKKPTAYFVNSMSDLFHEAVPFSYIDQVFAVMALCPQHLFLILTKRPERMAAFFSTRDRFSAVRPKRVKAFAEQYEPFTVEHISQHQHPLPNVWLGTSVEDQKTADERIPHLLKCPAAVRFLSCEPLLGPVQMKQEWLEGGGDYEHADDCNLPACGGTGDPELDCNGKWHELPRIHWVICGGESGPGARPMHPDWARGLRDQCQEAGVPFFFKQWGLYQPGSALDFDRNIVLLNNGDRLPYMNMEAYTTLDQKMRWSELAATAMHRGWKKSAKLLDGRTHLEFPEAITTQSVPA